MAALVIGRDGRLYAETDRGVYRTVEPVPVANEQNSPPVANDMVRVNVMPNPVHGWAQVTLRLVEASRVRVAVYDVLGREVAVLAEGRLAAGTHTLPWETGPLPGGVYIARAEAEGASVSRRVTVAGR